MQLLKVHKKFFSVHYITNNAIHDRTVVSLSCRAISIGISMLLSHESFHHVVNTVVIIRFQYVETHDVITKHE